MAKNHNREDWEDRSAPYRAWRYGVKCGTYVSDVDQVEYRGSEETGLYPVAVVELTTPTGPVLCPERYLPKILERYTFNSPQRWVVVRAASGMKVFAWLVVYEVLDHGEMGRFWLWNLSSYDGWWGPWTADRYARWLKEGCLGLNAEPRMG